MQSSMQSELSDSSRDRNVQGDKTVPLMRDNTQVEESKSTACFQLSLIDDLGVNTHGLVQKRLNRPILCPFSSQARLLTATT